MVKGNTRWRTLLSRIRTLLTVGLLAATGATATIFVVRSSRAEPEIESSVPPEAQQAMREGRYHRAARIMREYLASTNDTTAAALLIASQAEAGIENWPAVEELLSERSWLDTYANGVGWGLLGRARMALGEWAESEAAFARYLRVNKRLNDRQRGIAELRRAAVLTEQNKHEEALAAYDRAADLLPAIRDWIAVFGAGAAASAGDTSGVERRFAGLDDDLREWAWRTRVRAYEQSGDSARARQLATEIGRTAGAARRRAEALNLAGALLLAAGDTANARESLRQAMVALPNSDVAYSAAQRLIELPGLDAQDRLRIGRVYLRYGSEERGLRALEAYLASSGVTSAQQQQIRLEIARHHFNRRRYDAAERELVRLTSAGVARSTAAEALYLLARAQYRDGREEAARETFRRVANSYPGHSAATRSLFMLADLDHDDREMTRAAEYYRRAVESGGTSSEAALSLMRLGVIALTEGRLEEARGVFESYYRRFQAGARRQQAAFWLARTHQRLGNDSTARALYAEARRISPFSYYGVRAADQLNTPVLQGVSTAEPGTTEQEAEAVRSALFRIDLLREIGWMDAAAYEVARARRAFDGQHGALYAYAEALNARDYASAASEIGRELQRRERTLNTRLLRILYPLPFADLIVAEAREKGVDPFFAAALIRQESAFRPTVVSPAGAIGLMQVMPATGGVVARQLGLTRFSPEDLKEPEINVMIGMRYLADRLARFGQRPELALAAYNAGTARVEIWQEFPEAADPELFSERIPYEETRDYVRIVQLNARIYNALYGSPPATGKAAP